MSLKEQFLQDFPGTYTVLPIALVEKVKRLSLPEKEENELLETIAQFDETYLQIFKTLLEADS